MTDHPIPNAPRGIGLRQRKGAGGWRVWWEPTAAERARGAQAVDLDPNRPTWSVREAKRLKAEAKGDAPRRTASTGRTLAALVQDYLRSPRALSRAPATLQGYKADAAVLLQDWGDDRAVARMDRPAVYAWWRKRHASAPTYAGKLVRTLSVLLSHAELLGWREPNSNPCFRLGASGPAQRKRHASWSEFDALLGSAQVLGLPSMRLAIAMAVLTGQRPADLRAACVGDFREVSVTVETGGTRQVWIWNLRRQKRGNVGSVPVHPDLLPLLRPALDGRTADERLLVDERTGAPLTENTMANRWEDVRARASAGPGAADLHAHYAGTALLPDAALHPVPSLLDPVLQLRDLRRTFGVWARAGGALREDVGDVLGNTAGTDATLGEVYMPAQLLTAARAVAAIQRPEAEDRKRG